MNILNIPKVELHRHLDCSMRFSTLLDIAKTMKLELPKSIEEQRQKFLITEPMKDLESVLSKFMTAQKVLHSEEVLTRLAFEATEDAYNDGIKIIEFRYAPTFIQDGHSHLSFEKIHQALLKGLKMAEEKYPIATGLICIIQRILPVKTAELVADFTIENKETFIGLDLADNEEGFDSKPFSKVFHKAKNAGLHITVHSGEINTLKAPWYVKDAIEILGAERIGHGLQIHREPEMIEFVKRNNIHLELCLTSNWLTQAVPSIKEHPIKKLMESGVKFSINTDDPGIFDINLIGEYELLHKHYQMSEIQFTQINNTAAQASFIKLEKKQRHWPSAIL